MCRDHLPTSPDMLHWIIGKSEGPPSKSCFLFCTGGLNWKSPWTKESYVFHNHHNDKAWLCWNFDFPFERVFFVGGPGFCFFFKWVVQPPQGQRTYALPIGFAGQLSVSEGTSDCHFSILTACGNCCINN